MDAAEFKKRRQDAMDFAGNILNSFKIQFGNNAAKKSLLFNIQKPLIGNYPEIIVIINPNNENKKPQKEIINQS